MATAAMAREWRAAWASQTVRHFTTAVGIALGVLAFGVLLYVVEKHLLEPPQRFATSFQLASGRVDIYQLVGATDAEVEFARQANQDTLVALLQKEGVYPEIDAARKSVR